MPANILLLTHTESSYAYHPTGMGEIVHSAKFQKIIQNDSKKKVKRIDLYDLFESFETYESLAEMNYALAEAGHALLDLKDHPAYRKVLERIAKNAPDFLFLLTWCWGTAALFGVGVHHLCPIIAKLYVFQEKERVITPLYEKSAMLITESLLANKRGIDYGIPSSKMIYIPHQFPENIHEISPDKSYIERLASKNGKKIALTSNTVIIGMPSRIELRKNCGFALNAIAKLAQQGADILFILKGNFMAPEGISNEMNQLMQQPWFLWDPTPTPFPEVLREYAVFDVCLQLSGYEGASNTVVELLALGKPVLVLEGTTNPYLFKEGAFFLKAQKKMLGTSMPYQVPDEKHLDEVLAAFIADKKLREEWGKKGKKIAFERFHPEKAFERLPLLLEASQRNSPHLKEKIECLYESDCKAYGIF